MSMETPEDFEFVNEDSISEDLFCPICHSVLIQPVTTSCCQNMFCKKCISVTQNKEKNCPLCDVKGFTVYPPPKCVTNQINSLKVKCQICKMDFELYNFQVHLKICKNEHSKSCEGESLGCKFRGNEKPLKEHEKNCFYIIGKDFILNFKEENELLGIKIIALENEIKELKTLIMQTKIDGDNKNNGKTIPNSIRECVISNVCTFSFTRCEHKTQNLYSCRTCNYVKGICICQTCVDTCHDGHDVVLNFNGAGYCDCGLNPTNCKSVIPEKYDHKHLKNIILKSMKDCYDYGVCTYKLTGLEYAHQIYYDCITCDLTDHTGVCASCVARCHLGHKIEKKVKYGSFFCDCHGSGYCKIK